MPGAAVACQAQWVGSRCLRRFGSSALAIVFGHTFVKPCGRRGGGAVAAALGLRQQDELSKLRQQVQLLELRQQGKLCDYRGPLGVRGRASGAAGEP